MPFVWSVGEGGSSRAHAGGGQASDAAEGRADLRGEVTTVEIGGGGRRDEDATRFMLALDVSEGAARWREEVVDMAAPSRLRSRDFSPKGQSRAAVPCPHPSMEESLIPSLSAGVVGSRFVTQDEVETAKLRREEQWKAAYARSGNNSPAHLLLNVLLHQARPRTSPTAARRSLRRSIPCRSEYIHPSNCLAVLTPYCWF